MSNKDSSFLDAVKDVKPLKKKSDTVSFESKKPKPIPKKLIEDEKNVLHDSLSDHYLVAELEADENTHYLKEGHSPDIIRKLRGGFWVIQDSIDLHGLTTDEAKIYLSDFLHECLHRNKRCIRIIHGKGIGSKNREPVLKKKVRSWLIQKNEVIAYVEAPKYDGGSGAIIVLIKNS